MSKVLELYYILRTNRIIPQIKKVFKWKWEMIGGHSYMDIHLQQRMENAVWFEFCEEDEMVLVDT